MDFTLTSEQRLIVETVRGFVENELYPHEDEVERLDEVPAGLASAIRGKALAAGLYAANMPAELGGGGLDALSVVLVERELGRASYGLQMLVERPSNVLLACEGEQRERYLLPAVRGERHDCVAMTEPGAGSDVRSMTTRAVRDGGDYVINGTKHFISHADVADFIILFAAPGEEHTSRGPRKPIPTELEAAELLTLRAGARLDQGTMTDSDAAMAKLYASEMLGHVTDAAVQIFGGMGLMSDLPAERWWRDARVERIWDGTSEIQRHIISRALLRPYGG